MLKVARHISLITALLLSSLWTGAEARNGSKDSFLDVFTFGVEGSYVCNFTTYRHFNFISSYGYRLDRKYWSSKLHSNGEFLVHVGFNTSDHINLSLYTGYSGIYKFRQVIPLTFRLTGYFGKDIAHGRWLAFVDVGPGFSGKGDDMSVAGIWKIGSGYRVPLSRHTRLDFLFAFRTAMADPIAFDSNTGSSIYVPEENLRRNDALYLGVTFGIGITF